MRDDLTGTNSHCFPNFGVGIKNLILKILRVFTRLKLRLRLELEKILSFRSGVI